MINASADGKNGKVLLLGLSKKNITRLLKGKVMQCILEDLGIEGMEGQEIIIFAGESDASMTEELEELISS